MRLWGFSKKTKAKGPYETIADLLETEPDQWKVVPGGNLVFRADHKHAISVFTDAAGMPLRIQAFRSPDAKEKKLMQEAYGRWMVWLLEQP